MDPITIVVTALALGAAAGLQATAEQAVRDAYGALKALIKRKYAGVDVEQLEKAPASRARQALGEEELAQVEAGQDEELLQQAKRLLDAVEQHAPAAAGAVGVSLEEIKGASLRISDIIATGTGVSVKKADLSGDIDISGVRAGGSGESASKNS